MVEQLTIIEMFITLILSIILPLFLMLYLLVSKKIKAKSLIIGASGFLLTQFCVVSPMLTMLKKISFMGNEIISVFVSAIIIAGVDVLYTWWTFKYLLKTSKNRKNAISFGFGRGIMECFIGTGMATISNISLSLAISDGSIYKMTEISKESLERIVHVLTTAPGYIYLLSGIQSLCYILLYIIMSIFVLYAILKKDKKMAVKAFLIVYIIRLGSSLLSSFSIILTMIFILSLTVYGIVFLKKIMQQRS